MAKIKVYADEDIDVGYAHEGDAGLDLMSAEDCSSDTERGVDGYGSTGV